MRIAYFPASSCHFTIDGRFLCFGNTGKVSVEIIPRLHHKSDWNNHPLDVIGTEIRVCDSEGKVWSVTSCVLADEILRHVFDLSSGRDMHLLRCDPVSGEADSRCTLWNESIRQRMLLQNIGCYCDSRSTVTLLFRENDREVLKQVFLKYSMFVFEISQCSSDDDEFGSEDLAIRVNWQMPGALLETKYFEGQGDDLEQHDIGPFGFFMNYPYLLGNNAFYCDYRERWFASALPLPLRFRPTGETGLPQPHVRVLDPMLDVQPVSMPRTN